MSRQGPEPDPTHSHNQDTTDNRTSGRAWSILRLLRSKPPEEIQDPELRQEFEHLYNLLERIDALAEQELGISNAPAAEAEQPTAEPMSEPEPVDDSEPEPEPEPTPQADVTPETEPEPTVDPGLVEFDPFEFDVPTTASAWLPGVEQSDQPDVFSFFAQQLGSEPTPDDNAADPEPPPATEPEEQNLERWWVQFNGEVSLQRLARLRQTLGDSPFTIETRFDAITEGLILLRVVTEPNLTLEQLEWIVRQVMLGVGLDRDAAIISRN